MNSSPEVQTRDIDKWQQMAIVVNQHSTLLASNPTYQFKKLVFSRFLTENVLVLLLQYTGLLFSTFTPHSILWFASGTACAFVFMRGYSVISGIWLGSFLAYLSIRSNFGNALACSTILSLQAYALLWLSYRYIFPTLLFDNANTFLKFVCCSAMVTAITSFSLAYLWYSTKFYLAGFLWWLSNFNGVLVVACALIAWDAYFSEFYVVLQKCKYYLFHGLLFITAIILLLNRLPISTVFLTLTILSFIIICSSFGWCSAVFAIMLLALVLSFGARLDAPIYSTDFSSITVIYLQIVLCTATLIALYMASRTVLNSNAIGK